MGRNGRSVKPSAQPTLVRTQHLPRKSPGQPWCEHRADGGSGAVRNTAGGASDPDLRTSAARALPCLASASLVPENARRSSAPIVACPCRRGVPLISAVGNLYAMPSGQPPVCCPHEAGLTVTEGDQSWHCAAWGERNRSIICGFAILVTHVVLGSDQPVRGGLGALPADGRHRLHVPGAGWPSASGGPPCCCCGSFGRLQPGRSALGGCMRRG